MEYERIRRKPPSNQQQGGGFSPGKLRAILLGIEKRQREEEELASGIALRSDDDGDDDEEIEDRGADALEICREVDVVSAPPPQSSTSVDLATGYRPRVRAQEEDSFDSDSVSSSAFEFHKTPERFPQRSPLMPPFSKLPPSKWDDAQKWIGSPTSNLSSKGGGGGGGGGGLQSKKSSLGGYGNRSFGSKVVLEVTDAVDTKRIDRSQANKDVGEQESFNMVPETLPSVVSANKYPSVFENPFADSAIRLSKQDLSDTARSATTFVPPPTVKSVSMRDMGTEMTPIASQEASQTGTPIKPASPIRSPSSSRPLSPAKAGPTTSAVELSARLDSGNKLSEKELKMKTRKEIMVLGQQLGKMNIAAWASKEEEESDENVEVGQPDKSLNEARAAAWEDAEKSKYLARFKQEEIKIQAWENHQKAKTEAEMRKIEVEVEKMRARAHEKLMYQLAAARHKAEEKRAAAEARRNKEAAKTAQQAEHIKRTGRVPAPFSCWGFCF